MQSGLMTIGIFITGVFTFSSIKQIGITTVRAVFILKPILRSHKSNRKTFPLCMHENDCPSQSIFISKFLELGGDRIKAWKGHETVGQGYSIFQRTLPLNYKKVRSATF